MALRKSRIGSTGPGGARTPPLGHEAPASSGIGSQAPNTRSSSAASGTNSLIRGARWSVRLPRRMVAIWVSEPNGLAMPRRASSTPAMNVEATAPRPTHSTPSLPSAGAMGRAVLLAMRSSPFLRSGSPVRSAHAAALPGDPTDIHDALHHRDGGKDRQERHDHLQHDAPRPRGDQHRRHPDDEDALGE